jgi:hypothetical protein
VGFVVDKVPLGQVFLLPLLFILQSVILLILHALLLHVAGTIHTLEAMVPTEMDGFGGLVVSMLASGSRVRGFDPERSRWIFSDVKKILSMPSFGGEVK